MNENKRLKVQEKLIRLQSQQIEMLKAKNEQLNLEIERKNQVINSVFSLKDELAQNIAEIKKQKEEYNKLIEDLKLMKNIVDKEVYKGRWGLVKFIIK